VCVDIIDRYYVGAANLKLLDYLNMIIGSSGTDAVTQLDQINNTIIIK
jgi:hypothetical protein